MQRVCRCLKPIIISALAVYFVGMVLMIPLIVVGGFVSPSLLSSGLETCTCNGMIHDILQTQPRMKASSAVTLVIINPTSKTHIRLAILIGVPALPTWTDIQLSDSDGDCMALPFCDCH